MLFHTNTKVCLIYFDQDCSVAEKQYQIFDKVFNLDEKEEPVKIEKEERLKTAELSLIYNNRYSFSEFKKVGNESLVSRYNNFLTPFKQIPKIYFSNSENKRVQEDCV